MKIIKQKSVIIAAAFFVHLLVQGTATAQDVADLARQLSNPVASLISVPLQLNWDQDIGPADDGERYTLNIQPVVPVSIGED